VIPARPFLRPRALRRGDKVALLSLASVPRAEDVAAGADQLRDLGFEPVIGEGCAGAAPYVAGPAPLRAAQLRDHLHDPSIAAIIATRGGYGSAHLLPFLDLASVRHACKLLIGYSDITALLDTFTGHAGVITVHGPMVEGRLARGAEAYDAESFLRIVCEPVAFGPVATPAATVLAAGEATGVLRGGTLTQIAALLGTPWAWCATEDTILFLDDVNERPYRLDRMLFQLRHAGVLSHVRGIVFNELPGCDEPGGAVTAIDAVRHALAHFEGPIVANVPSGHTPGAMITLPFGVGVSLHAGDEVVIAIDEPAVAPAGT
jgi:muramoyltetrapeptide carboxypeptidase